jgi:O-antigen/teichoic acid export membrane protein
MMGLQRPLTAQLPESLALPLLFLVLLVGFGQVGQLSAGLAILLQLAAGAAAALLAVALLFRSLPDAVRRAAPAGETPSWARSLLPMTLLTGAAAVSAQVPILMLGAMRGPEAAGLMAVTKSLSDLAAVPTIALGTILAPLLGRLWAERDTAGLQRALTLFARKVSFTALPLILVLLLFRQPLLQLFGAPFAAGAGALLILCLGQAASAVAGSNGLLLTMTGHERTVATVSVACLLANVGLCAVLIPPFGLEGAAAASAGALFAWNLWLAICSRKLLGVRPSAFAQLG